jgi:nicotinamidase/pyrazinamidase
MTRAPTIFFDVDTQRDFIEPDGNLAVSDAAEIRPNLRNLTRFAVDNGVPILATADAHRPNDPEFEDFYPHCVVGTEGQEKIPETTAERYSVALADMLENQLNRLTEGDLQQLVFFKQQLDPFATDLLPEALRRLRPATACLYGVMTEHCVLRAAHGLVERVDNVLLVQDAIKARDDQAGREAMEQMTEAGVELTTTEEALKRVTGS